MSLFDFYVGQQLNDNKEEKIDKVMDIIREIWQGENNPGKIAKRKVINKHNNKKGGRQITSRTLRLLLKPECAVHGHSSHLQSSLDNS